MHVTKCVIDKKRRPAGDRSEGDKRRHENLVRVSPLAFRAGLRFGAACVLVMAVTADDEALQHVKDCSK